ncbi:MAG: ATP-binding protein [Micropruina sp.]
MAHPFHGRRAGHRPGPHRDAVGDHETTQHPDAELAEVAGDRQLVRIAFGTPADRRQQLPDLRQGHADAVIDAAHRFTGRARRVQPNLPAGIAAIGQPGAGSDGVHRVLQELAADRSDVGRRLLSLPEDQWFDRKSIRVRAQDLDRPLTAFANAEGGVIVIGLSDGRVEGIRSQASKHQCGLSAVRTASAGPVS